MKTSKLSKKEINSKKKQLEKNLNKLSEISDIPIITTQEVKSNKFPKSDITYTKIILILFPTFKKKSELGVGYTDKGVGSFYQDQLKDLRNCHVLVRYPDTEKSTDSRYYLNKQVLKKHLKNSIKHQEKIEAIHENQWHSYFQSR